MLQVAESLKKLRVENHYTQEQLANICGVSRQSVTKWESGTSIPDVEKLVQLAQLFHTTVDVLLNGSDTLAVSSSVPRQPDVALQNEKIVNQALQEAIFGNGIDEAIVKFLSSIGQKIGCDRLYIFEANFDGSYHNTYEWCAPGVASQLEFLQNIPAADMSAWLETFSRGECMIVEDVEALADSDAAAYRWLKPQGVHSLLAYPLFQGRCFLGIDNPVPAFRPHILALLANMSHFVESMLQHKDVLQGVKEAGKQGAAYQPNNKGVFYQMNVLSGQICYDVAQANKLGYPGRLNSLEQLNAVLAFHPECGDHIMIDGIQRSIQTKKNLCVEFLSIKENHEARWNKISFSPFIDSKGKVLQLYGVLQDVSSEHQIVKQYNNYLTHLTAGLHICYLSQPIHLSYASDDLCKFTGYSRDEFEQLAGYKYSNIIVEEDRAVFSKYAKSLGAAPGIASCEYRIRKKDGSIVPVIDTMESILDCNGIMYGYAYVLDKAQIQVLLAQAEKQGKRHLALLGEQSELLKVLAKEYTDVFRVWLDEDKIQLVKIADSVSWDKESESAEYLPYYSSCQQLIETYVAPEDRAKMLQDLHPDTVRQVLSHSDEYQLVYRVLNQGETHFYQIKYIRLHNKDFEKSINFIGGCKNIDSIIAAEKEHKEQLVRRQEIIETILQAFYSGYFLDYENDTYMELTHSSSDSYDGIFKLIGKCGRISAVSKCWQEAFPDRNAAREICEFLNAETIEARLAGRKSISVQIAVQAQEWYEMYFLAVDYNAKGKLAHGIVVVRDITAEKKQQDEYQSSLSLARQSEQKALKYAFTDILTGVRNRNAFERDVRLLKDHDRVGFIFCDINNLKQVNDSQGHSKGDLLLQDFAKLLEKYFSSACIYRIGGDEFVCMISNISKEDFLARVGELNHMVKVQDNIASIGATYGNPEQRKMLLREAELIMYNMKEANGRRKAKLINRFEG